jgi:acyl homoserine lactone synthase
MIEVVNWSTSHLFGDAIAQQHRLRHRLFIERNGWDVPTHDGMEYDQFDTPAANYLIHRGEGGRVQGVARLIPTTRPYMLKELWPEMLEGDVPTHPSVWEATRFGIDESLEPAVKRRIAAEIVLGCLEYGLSMGVERYLVLMPALIIRRTIRGAGCEVRFLGQSRELAEYPVSAAEIRVTPQALASARARAGIDWPIIMDHGLTQVAA